MCLWMVSVQFSSVAQSCLTLCDPMNCSTPGLPVHHQLPEFTQTQSIEPMMPSSHLILCRPLLLLPPISPSIRVFSNESFPYMTTGKTIALTRWTFVGKVMSLLLNMLSRLVITFPPRSKRLLISWLKSPSTVSFEPPKINSDTVSTVSPSVHCFLVILFPENIWETPGLKRWVGKVHLSSVFLKHLYRIYIISSLHSL